MGDPTTKRAKGVAIGITREVKFSLKERMVDPRGWYIFLKERLHKMDCTLANIYCPNNNPTHYLKEVLGNLMHFKIGKLILAGDLSFCLDPQVDAQGIGNHQLRMVKKKLYQYQMVDV